jgi:hypothetical protein
MERKKALIAAASATLVLATSGAAIAANLSLLGDDGGDVGQLDAESVTSLVSDVEPTTTSTTLPGGQVIIVDEWVTDPAAPPASGSVDPSTAGVDLSGDGLPDDNPTPGSSSDDGSSDDDAYDDSYEDDEHEDDEFEDEDEHEDEHEDEDGEDEHEDDD